MNSGVVSEKTKGNEAEDRKLKFGEKIAVNISQGIGTLHFQIIQMFLLFFYTDVMGVSAAYIAGLFLVTRIVDAFLAPILGIVVDRTTTRFGKYRPWMIAYTALLGVFGWLTFTNFDLSHTSKLIYVTITYVIYSVVGAIGGGPSVAIIPAITKRMDERVSLGQIGYFAILIGAIVAQIAIQPLYKVLGGGNDAKGFSLTMGIIAIISVLMAAYQAVKIKERYVVQKQEGEKSASFKQMFIATLTNRTAIIAYLYVLGTNLGMGIRSAVMLHYFKYYFHDEGLVVVVGLISMVPTMVGVMLSSKITKLIGIKANLLIYFIINLVGTAAIIVIPATPSGVNLFMAVSVLIGLFNGFASPAQGTMMPAAMDYTEWKSGLNINAFMGSIQGFLQTLATALSGAIAAGALAFIGYVPGVEQSSSTLFGLKMVMGILPAVAILLTAGIIWFDLTEDKQAQISKELAERRNRTTSK